MAYENLLYERKDRIGTITVNRPERLNALNVRTIQELAAVLSEAAEDQGVRVLIVTGAGEKAFVAGADIKELAANDAGERKRNGAARPGGISQA